MQKMYGYGLVLLAASLPTVVLAEASVRIAAGPGLFEGQRGIVTHGTQASQSYLGIDVRDVGDDEVVALKLKDSRGAEIIRVDHDGPAGQMGLREHDVVIQMNGIVVEGEDQIRRMLRESAPGRTVILVVSRDGQQITLTTQMADRAEVERQAWEKHLAVPQAPASALPSDDAAGASAPPYGSPAASRYGKSFLPNFLMSPSYTGAMLEMMGPQLAEFFGVQSGIGLLVRSVENNSPAAVAGMHAGDVVVRANGQAISSIGDWAKNIRDAKGRPVTVVVLRDRQEKTLTLRPDGKRRSSLQMPFGSERTRQMACLTEL